MKNENIISNGQFQMVSSNVDIIPVYACFSCAVTFFSSSCVCGPQKLSKIALFLSDVFARKYRFSLSVYDGYDLTLL